MTPTENLYLAAVLCFALFAGLGLYVSRRPLGRYDAAAVHFRGQGTPVALIFTKSGRSRALTVLCILAVLFFYLTHRPLWIPMVIVGSQLVSQILIETVKTGYRRTRPDYWLVGMDAGHSYPSGHSATAVIFFIGWAAVVAFSGLPPGWKFALMGLLAAWAAGIWWSRLALGAHYLSDVIGGALFGCAWMLALYATLAQLALLPKI